MSQLQKNLDYVSSIEYTFYRDREIERLCIELLIRHVSIAKLEAISFVKWYFYGLYVCRGIPKEVVKLLVEEAKKKIAKSRVPVMDMVEQYKKRFRWYLWEIMEYSLWEQAKDNERDAKKPKRKTLQSDRH